MFDVCFQDPEVQKHASEILRKMLEQEEAELQVRSSGDLLCRIGLHHSQNCCGHCASELAGGEVEEPLAVPGGAHRARQEESAPSSGQDPARSGKTKHLL